VHDPRRGPASRGDRRPHDQAHLPPVDRAHAPTIEDVFAQEKADRSDDTIGRVHIRYDPIWGFPASVNDDCPFAASDCGSGYAINNFQVIHPAR
jgi:hypothetical protein